ncbi:MAG: S41 family peptidase [Saccharofermentans sp.]|nr:S41 family peptidase [Saccharofermentans sp.]
MKRFLGICIAVWLLVLAVVPLNLFFVSMGDLILGICLIAVLVAMLLFIVKASSGKKSKITVSVISVFVMAAFIMAGYVCNPYWNSINLRINSTLASKAYDYELTSKEAMEDLEYAVRYLKKNHPACYHGLPEELNNRYEEVKSEIKARDSITVNELSRYIESIFSIIGDGHTFASVIDRNDRYLKYVYGWDGEGYEISAVNGITISELLTDKSDLYSFEAESWERLNIANDIISISGLDYLGIEIGDGVTYTITNDEGDSRDIICHDEDFVTIEEYNEYNNIDSSSDKEESFVSYEIDEEKSLAVLTLDECIIDDEYRDTVRAMFTEVRDKNIQNVAVDVRFNPGGNDAVVSEFIRYLDIDEYKICTCQWRLGPIMINADHSVNHNDRNEELLFHGNVYVLTTANTFSSGMIFAQYIKDNNLGIIVGEAPGNDPNGYGEITSFLLPNSGIYMQISTKNWVRADSSAPEGLIEPDIECDVKHYDDAMNAIYIAISEEQ